MKDKVVIFIDQVAAKNKLQINAIQQFGYIPFCFVTDVKPGSEFYFAKSGVQQKLEKKFFARLKQVLFFLKRHRKSIHHVEFYPGGRFSFMYTLLGRLFFLKTLCIERGDLLYYNRTGYSLTTRLSMWFCYRFSKIVWYRELYMKSKLEKIRKNNLFFLHNAIENIDHVYQPALKKDIDFLWLNRVIPERKYKWFLNILHKKNFEYSNNYLVGLLDQTTYSADQEYVKTNKPANLILAGYSNDPSSFFKRSRFFVLPADVVFANHALLEAMAYGVVPLISSRPGSELIVDNNINGFIFEHTESGFNEAMEKAMKLPDETYALYSACASEKVRTEFSEKKYIASLRSLYKMLD